MSAMNKKRARLATPRPKNQIYFARTYRHLRFNRRSCALFMLLFMLPGLVLLLFGYDELTHAMSSLAAWLLEQGGVSGTSIMTSQFLPLLGPVYYLAVPTTQPGYSFILANLGTVLLIMWGLCTGNRKGKPVGIYLLIVMIIHAMSCVFFLLGRDLFPYTITTYSDLYVKQQVGIWITFFVLICLIMGILSRNAVVSRVITSLCVMGYSVAFGFVRYALFLWLLYRFSTLYIAVMFFALGPLFDFLYFVMVYSLSANRLIREYESTLRAEWEWA